MHTSTASLRITHLTSSSLLLLIIFFANSVHSCWKITSAARIVIQLILHRQHLIHPFRCSFLSWGKFENIFACLTVSFTSLDHILVSHLSRKIVQLNVTRISHMSRAFFTKAPHPPLVFVYTLRSKNCNQKDGPTLQHMDYDFRPEVMVNFLWFFFHAATVVKPSLSLMAYGCGTKKSLELQCCGIHAMSDDVRTTTTKYAVERLEFKTVGSHYWIQSPVMNLYVMTTFANCVSMNLGVCQCFWGRCRHALLQKTHLKTKGHTQCS